MNPASKLKLETTIKENLIALGKKFASEGKRDEAVDVLKEVFGDSSQSQGVITWLLDDGHIEDFNDTSFIQTGKNRVQMLLRFTVDNKT